MQAHPLTRRHGFSWQLQALSVIGAFVGVLGLRVATEPGLPERELPPTAAEWAAPLRDPIDLDLGAAGSVSVPAGWTIGHAFFDGPGGGGSYLLFQHRGSGTVLHLKDGTDRCCRSTSSASPIRMSEPRRKR